MFPIPVKDIPVKPKKYWPGLKVRIDMAEKGDKHPDWLGGVVEDVPFKGQPMIRVTDSHPVWYGALIKFSVYRDIQCLYDQSPPCPER